MLDFDRDGGAIYHGIVADAAIGKLKTEFAHLDFRAGARPFDLTATVAALIVDDGSLTELAWRISGATARPVRVLAFDKTPQSNWRLGWHQDRVIAVSERVNVSGYSNWTRKNGVEHVEAPSEILQAMFSLRLHLDDCDSDNGPLKIIKGSSKLGKLPDTEVKQAAAEGDAATCEARAGDVVAMKALTIHASDAAKQASHRRVLHVDYCSHELPYGLRWALAQPAG